MQPNDVGIVAKVVADAIQKAIAPLHAEIADLKARQPERGEKGEQGPAGATGLEGQTGKDGANGLDGKNGADGLNGDDGDDGQDGLPGANGRDGKDAEPVTPELVLAALKASPETIQKAVTLHFLADPVADGKDGSDGVNGKDGSDGAEGKEGPEGKPGRDGQPGVPGRDGDRGKDGADGQDALGFDDIQVEHDGERSFTFKFMRGDREKTFGSFVIPSVIYRSVYKDGAVYQKGDAVTFGGSLWVAQKDTKAKPGTHEDWRLAVKRGADGKDK